MPVRRGFAVPTESSQAQLPSPEGSLTAHRSLRRGLTCAAPGGLREAGHPPLPLAGRLGRRAMCSLGSCPEPGSLSWGLGGVAVGCSVGSAF